MHPSLYLCTHSTIYALIHTPTHQCTQPSIPLCTHQPLHVFIHPSMDPSIHPSSMYPFTHLPIKSIHPLNPLMNPFIYSPSIHSSRPLYNSHTSTVFLLVHPYTHPSSFIHPPFFNPTTYLSMCLFISLHLPIHPFITCLSITTHPHGQSPVYICLSIHSSSIPVICPSTYLSIQRFTHLSFCSVMNKLCWKAEV